MKAKLYVRVAHNRSSRRADTRVRAAASTRLDRNPLYSGDQVLPTVAFALELNIPDELFDQASKVIAEIDVDGDGAKIATLVAVPE